MSPEAFLARLSRVRHSGNGWQALCPAHHDRNPSLSVTAREGKILLFCHAGCSVESVCAALNVTVSDLFPDSCPTEKDRPGIVRDVERQVANLRSRLTPRERVLPVTVVCIGPENLDEGMARALALAVEGEIVQAVLEEQE